MKKSLQSVPVVVMPYFGIPNLKPNKEGLLKDKSILPSGETPRNKRRRTHSSENNDTELPSTKKCTTEIKKIDTPKKSSTVNYKPGPMLTLSAGPSKNLSLGPLRNKKIKMIEGVIISSSDEEALQTSPNISRRIQTSPSISGIVPKSPNISKRVQTSPNMSKKVQTSPNISKKVQTSPNMSKIDQTSPHRSKIDQTSPHRNKEEQTSPNISREEQSLFQSTSSRHYKCTTKVPCEEEPLLKESSNSSSRTEGSLDDSSKTVESYNITQIDEVKTKYDENLKKCVDNDEEEINVCDEEITECDENASTDADKNMINEDPPRHQDINRCNENSSTYISGFGGDTTRIDKDSSKLEKDTSKFEENTYKLGRGDNIEISHSRLSDESDEFNEDTAQFDNDITEHDRDTSRFDVDMASFEDDTARIVRGKSSCNDDSVRYVRNTSRFNDECSRYDRNTLRFDDVSRCNANAVRYDKDFNIYDETIDMYKSSLKQVGHARPSGKLATTLSQLLQSNTGHISDKDINVVTNVVRKCLDSSNMCPPGIVVETSDPINPCIRRAAFVEESESVDVNILDQIYSKKKFKNLKKRKLRKTEIGSDHGNPTFQEYNDNVDTAEVIAAATQSMKPVFRIKHKNKEQHTSHNLEEAQRIVNNKGENYLDHHKFLSFINNKENETHVNTPFKRTDVTSHSSTFKKQLSSMEFASDKDSSFNSEEDFIKPR